MYWVVGVMLANLSAPYLLHYVCFFWSVTKICLVGLSTSLSGSIHIYKFACKTYGFHCIKFISSRNPIVSFVTG